MQFPFGPLAPDAGETSAGALMAADGVIPTADGYRPAPMLYTDIGAQALPDTPRGLISLFQRDGTNLVFAFTGTNAYELSNTYQWISRGSGFTLTVGDDWSLAQFGNKLLATNTSQGLIQYDIESPTTFSNIVGAGDPREIFICANTVVALDCKDDAGNRDNRLIRTSAIGNQTNWDNTGADNQPLEDGGRLIGGVDLKNNAGLIFQDTSIRLMQFGAGNGAFSLSKIADGRGASGKRSIVSLDGVAYWLSTDGFKAFSLSGGIQHIGAGKIDEWFLNRVDLSALESVQGALDPANKLVVWRYKSLNAPSDVISDDMIGYNWQFDRWFTWTEQTTYLGRISTPGTTLDGMDYLGPLDGIDIPLDSRVWQGGQPVFAALDENRKYATFSGVNYRGLFRTATSNSPVTGLINWVTPIDDCPGTVVRLGVKSRLDAPFVWKNNSAKVSGGRVPVRGRGMNIAFECEYPSGQIWTYAKGLDHIKASVAEGPK